MKKTILLFCLLFLCFGFSDKGKLEIENLRVEENCCEFRYTDNIGYGKLILPTYTVYKNNYQPITENKTILLSEINVKKDSAYMFRCNLFNANGYLENTSISFLLNEQNDTLQTTFVKGKKYDGIIYVAKKDEKIGYYFNPCENPLLLQKHKKKDKCAKVRCLRYVIGIRSIVND